MKTTYPNNPLPFKEWREYIKRERTNLGLKIDGINPPIQHGTKVELEGRTWTVIHYFSGEVLLKSGNDHALCLCNLDGELTLKIKQ